MNLDPGQCVQMDLFEIQGSCAFGPAAEGKQRPKLLVAAELGMRYSPVMDDLHLVENGRGLMRWCTAPSSSILLMAATMRGGIKCTVLIWMRGRQCPSMVLTPKPCFIGSDHASSVCPKVFPSISADAIYPGFG